MLHSVLVWCDESSIIKSVPSAPDQTIVRNQIQKKRYTCVWVLVLLVVSFIFGIVKVSETCLEWANRVVSVSCQHLGLHFRGLPDTVADEIRMECWTVFDYGVILALKWQTRMKDNWYKLWWEINRVHIWSGGTFWMWDKNNTVWVGWTWWAIKAQQIWFEPIKYINVIKRYLQIFRQHPIHVRTRKGFWGRQW